ncbi:MAG TPA: hypothetical protein VMT85_09570, partial [Thermoanaerobaculia bacterium]|nr:hypothetical protein [Thermoanaerobaculia bacterium]
RFVFVVDCDLEEPPELLACFWERLHREPAVDVVYGVQRRRKGGVVERWSGRLFYPLLRFSTGLPLPRDTTMARLLRREYVDALLRHRESPMSIDVLFAVAGFRQEGVAVDKSSRGSSTYHLRRKLSLALRSLLLYSALPAWTCLALGASALAGGVSLGLSSLVRYGLEGLMARATLASLWVVGGGVLIASGMILLALDQVLAEVRRRPIVVSRIFAGDAAAAPATTLAETRENSG